MVAYLKVGLQVRTYSDLPKGCLGGRERRFYGAAQRPYGPDYQQCPKTSSCQFLPPAETQGQPAHLQMPVVLLAHLEEEDAGRDEDKEVNDLGGIERVTKEFMACLARTVKDTQAEEKHCYHCSSAEHFICNCLLLKTFRENEQLNSKEGMALKKGA